MTDIVLARVVHVLAVVLWIGGVGMVTTVLLPAIRAILAGRTAISGIPRAGSPVLAAGQDHDGAWPVSAASTWLGAWVPGAGFVCPASGGCTPWS